MHENVSWRPHPYCRRPHHFWRAPDEQAAEQEVVGFLLALARLTKPQVVVETGTYRGRTTVALATAVTRNGAGSVVTYEADVGAVAIARARLARWIAAGAVTLVSAAVSSGNLPASIDLAFLESSMTCRDAEMRLVWPRVTRGGLVVVHDAAPERPPGRVRPPGRHAMFDIATPRGLTIFQKPWRA